MANGLRKLIKQSRKQYNSTSILARRNHRFGSRLNVEELEERIAPATVTLLPGGDDFTTWDVGANNGTFEATDGIIGLADGASTGLVSNITGAVVTVVDNTAPTVTVDGANWGVGPTSIVSLASNKAIGAINLTNIPATVTTLRLSVIAGADGGFAGGPIITFTDDAGATYINNDFIAGETAVPAVNATGDVTAGVGLITITLAAAHPGLEVQIILETGVGTGGGGGTAGIDGDFTGFLSTSSLAKFGSSLGASRIVAENVTTFQIAGALDDDGSAFTINADDAIGTFSVGGIETTGGALNINAGGTGFSSVTTGAIAVSGGGSLVMTTTGAGSFSGLVTTGAITHNGVGAITIQPNPGGAGVMAGFTATGNITNTSTSTAAITIGSLGGALGALNLQGVANDAEAAGGAMTFQGLTISGITGTGNIETTDQGGAATAGVINFYSGDSMGAVNITGNVGGAGGTKVTFEADRANLGTAEAGDITSFTTSGTIAAGASPVDILGVNIGNVNAVSIGAGAGAVQIIADDGANTDTDGLTAKGTIGNIGSSGTLVSIGAGAGGVLISADDGVGTVAATGAIASGANVAILANEDGQDDQGAVGTVTAGTVIGTTGANTLVIDTNGFGASATDNTSATPRTVGAITANQGFARLNITSDGDVGLVMVQNGAGAAVGNNLEITVNTNGAGDPTNTIDLAGITVVDTVGLADTVTLSGDLTIGGIMGPIVSGATLADGDLLDLNGNNIFVFNGDDMTDGFDADYPGVGVTPENFAMNITSGDIVDGGGGGVIQFNAQNASPLFTALVDGVTLLVDISTTGVNARVTFDPDSGLGGDPEVAIDDIQGIAADGSTEIVVSTSDASEFDVSSITPASTETNVDLRAIRIEGDLTGNIGTPADLFGTVDLIVIEGNSAGTFNGTGLGGFAVGGGTLTLGPQVVITSLDRLVSDPFDITASGGGAVTFSFSVGGLTFNRHIIVDSAPGQTATVTVFGVDGNGDGDAGNVTAYDFSGNGQSGQAIDPAGVLAAAPNAVISRLALTNVDGMSTDVSVREVTGTMSGSWLEFETNVGLVQLLSSIETISVGIDDGLDAVDNAVLTTVAAVAGDGLDIGRLGGGQAGGLNQGLNPATTISDDDAALGQLIIWSMTVPGAANINLVVTGNSGPITLTGNITGDVPDFGNLVVFNNANAAAMAIGGNLAGAINILGQITSVSATAADILVGIGMDTNNDGDFQDAGETPSGSVNAAITVGSAPNTDILVANDVNADIAAIGQDTVVETVGLEVPGDLGGVKAIGNLNNDVIVHNQLDYVIADGVNGADIFSGGDGANNVLVEGNTITGAAVLGASNGVTAVTILDRSANVVGDNDQIAVTNGAMTVRWAAGGIGAADVLGDVYIFGTAAAATDLNITTNSGDAMTVGNIYLLDPTAAGSDITSAGDIGRVVAADDVNILSSTALQALINAAPDVVTEPTSLDTSVGDDGADLDFLGSVTAENAGGIIAEGDIDDNATGFNADGNFGDIVSLNGTIDASTGGVHAGLSIGHIVSSSDLDGEFISEGTLALGDATVLHTFLNAAGLEGVPAFFNGGILVESGDIIAGSRFVAKAPLVVGPGGIVVGSGDAMGLVFVVAGNIQGGVEINVFGNFVGIQVPAGAVNFIQLNVSGNIDLLIAPNYSETNSVHREAAIQAIDGEAIVAFGTDFEQGDVSVTITGTTIAIVDNDDADPTSIDQILLLMGLPAADTLTVMGDVDDLRIVGDWAGDIVIAGSPQDETDGVIRMLRLEGVVVPATASLVGGDVMQFVGDFSAVTTTTTITGGQRVDFARLDNPALRQTIYLAGSPTVNGEITRIFNKVDMIELSGSGFTSIVSVEGVVTNTTDLLFDEIFTLIGRPDLAADITGEGSAHIGDVEVAPGSPIFLRSVVADGNVADVTTPGNLQNLYVAGDAGTIDINGTINRAFIGDDVDAFHANFALNTRIGGDVGTFSAGNVINANVQGTTGVLRVTRLLINSNFVGAVGVIDINNALTFGTSIG